MKKFKILLCVVLVTFLMCICSCKEVNVLNGQNHGKVKYYVSGLYIEVHKQDVCSIDDNNPKVYFRFDSSKYFGTFKTTSGNGKSYVTVNYTSNNKKVENEINKYFGSVNCTLIDESVSSVNVYLITCDKNGNYEINTKAKEKLSVPFDEMYNFTSEFIYNKEDYQIQIQLKIN